MPLLTSKNIWCPCLPHRLICNTFCCCFHLTSIARVNNNLHFLYFIFLLFSQFIWSLVLFLLLDRVTSETTSMRWGCIVKFGAQLLFSVPPPPLLLSSACSSWSRPGCCNTFETSQIPCVLPYKKIGKNNTSAHWKSLALGLSQWP